MEKEAIISRMKELVEHEEILSVSHEGKELKVAFDDLILEEERQHQIAQLEATEKGESIAPYYDLNNDAFYEIYAQFRTKVKEESERVKTTENESLKQKKVLLDQFRSLIQEEENVGKAYSTLKDIQEKWNTIGDIPREKRHDVQQEYSRLKEQFFYNIKIFKELKEHDLHRNKQLKEQVIEKIDALSKQEDLKSLESELKLLQNEWDEIGPTVQADWETIRESYWTKVKLIYDKIKSLYEARRGAMAENIHLKQALVEKAQAVLDGTDELTTIGLWNKSTEKILQLQEDWKKIGFGSRKENEQVWKNFRSVCDAFFERKKSFFSDKKADFNVVKAKKEELIAELQGLSTSEDWKETTAKIVQLQKRWKDVGNAGPKFEQKLWKEFRDLCDGFFQRKDVFFNGLESENNENLAKKEALLQTISAYQVKADKKETLLDLKQFSTDFNAIGNVPHKEKDRIYSAFKKAMDTHYNALDLSGEEKENVLFRAKVETLKSSPDAEKRFAQEKRGLSTEIQRLKSEVIQLETNIGFFAKSKNADVFLKEIRGKIELANKKIASLTAKIKLLQ